MSFVDFSGARRIPLIGRRDLLQEVEHRIRRGGAHVLYFEGDGGIGKTALLESVLENSWRAGEEGSLCAACVAQEIVDLYHADVHTPEGLIRRIIQVVGGDFRQSQKALSALDRARSIGNVDLANEKTIALQSSFLDEFGALSEDGVVLAFDTLEVLEYERESFQVELSADMPILSAGEWLFQSFFPVLQGNVVILLAGRPGGVKEQLGVLRERNPHLQLRYIPLTALQEHETEEYLKTVARSEEDLGNVDAAARLWEFCEERGDTVHFLTGGRPILLALVADMVAHGWTLPPAFGRTREELDQRGSDAWQREIEWALIVRIQESPTPLGDTIRALAWLRKGATPELLAQVMDLSTPDGEWDAEAAQESLDQVTRLTLIKVRPGDGRIFLHDEMYALLDKYILQESSQAEQDRVYEAVLKYYQDTIQALQERIEQSASASVLLHGRFRQAHVEDVHYRLRYRPPMGFATYFWLAEEALVSRDTEFDMLLRTELLRTVGMLKDGEALAGLDPREVEIDTAVRWGMRALFLQGDSERALELFELIRERWAREIESIPLAWSHLLLCQAVAKIWRAEEGDWIQARTLLDQVEQATDQMTEDPADLPVPRSFLWLVRLPKEPTTPPAGESYRWRTRILKAAAFNYQGYLDRQQGQYVEAVRHYQASAMLQRRLAMTGLAPILINLSYAMALTGEFRHARLLAEEAERWAKSRGRDRVLAMALNARALVEAYDGHPRSALLYTDRALTVSRGLRAPRVRGLIYLTRARAHRYVFVHFAEEEEAREQVLDEALKEANQAVNLLKNTPSDRVTALIERGCMYREIARGYYLQHRDVAAFQATQRSQRDLDRAVALAEAMGLASQQALAWTDLGWLWYYAGQPDEAMAALQSAYASVPSEYLFPSYGSLPPMAHQDRKSEACLPFWSTLGKAEMLEAYIALDRVQLALEEEKRDLILSRAVRHITRSLTYDEQIASEYFDITRAEEGLHKRIFEDRLNVGRLHQHAAQAAGDHDLTQPTRFQKFLDRMFGPADLWA